MVIGIVFHWYSVRLFDGLGSPFVLAGGGFCVGDEICLFVDVLIIIIWCVEQVFVHLVGVWLASVLGVEIIIVLVWISINLCQNSNILKMIEFTNNIESIK